LTTAAVIAVEPLETAETTPPGFVVAIVGLLELHVAGGAVTEPTTACCEVRLTVVPVDVVPMATN
jgi:hypothetical protein